MSDGFHEECPDCGYDEPNCQCDKDFMDDLDCTHCCGDGICDDGYDDIGGSCPSTAHFCHACKGTGRRRDQVFF
jgi:hypothetical protein